jgi:hypothetical protein
MSWFQVPGPQIVVGQSEEQSDKWSSIQTGIVGGLVVAGLLVAGLHLFSYLALRAGYGDVS